MRNSRDLYFIKNIQLPVKNVCVRLHTRVFVMGVHMCVHFRMVRVCVVSACVCACVYLCLYVCIQELFKHFFVAVIHFLKNPTL